LTSSGIISLAWHAAKVVLHVAEYESKLQQRNSLTEAERYGEHSILDVQTKPEIKVEGSQTTHIKTVNSRFRSEDEVAN
jgi:hypothetical protein